MSDHGVAIITGRGLVEWLLLPKNLAALPRFIGQEKTASESSNPQPGVKVASLEKFFAIGEVLKDAYRDIAKNSLPLTVGSITAECFQKKGLLWPQLEAALKLIELRDLK